MPAKPANLDPHSAEAAPDDRETQRTRAEEQVEALVEGGAPAVELAPAVAELEAPDAADRLEDLQPDASAEVLHEMENEAAADALAYMEPPLAATVIIDLEPAEASQLIDLMDPDDAADLIQELPDPLASDLLARMSSRRAAVLGKLALYDKESAGGMMTTDILVVRDEMTIGLATDAIKAQPSEEEQLDVYVVDDDRRLVGTISLRDLLVTENDRLVSDHLDPDIDVLTPELDREEVAKAFERYDYITMPVVDRERRVLGMVTIDDVVDIIESELSEDPLVQVGAGAREAAYSSVGEKFRSRSPWLVVNLVAAQAGAAVLLLFHGFIELLPIVAVVYPVIANQSGNAGHQSLAVTLRGLALGQVRKDIVIKLLQREMITGVFTGLVVGVVFALALSLLHLGIPAIDWRLGVVAGVAMAIAMPVACLVGTAIPLVFERLGFDPAAASSIFLTAVTDFLAYGIFLTLAFTARVWLNVAEATPTGG